MKLALGIEYNGSKYCGWQRQSQLLSIQIQIENAIAKIANHPVDVVCAGRTDAGVHSKGQVIHFETTTQRTDLAWTIGVNSHLPADVSVIWIKKVSNNFHARYSAISRRYIYIIYNNRLKPAILNKKVLHYYKPLNADKMHDAGQYLVGINDFSAFRSAKCQSNSPFRNLLHINVMRYDLYIIVDIKANSFLHNMMRNIVGSLIEVGSGNQDKKWIQMLLHCKNRQISAATAKAHGLYLFSVDYPEVFKIPPILNKMFFF